VNSRRTYALAEQNLKEPREVHLGEQTLDEMCIAGLAVAFPYVMP
jgi:hypothetical protein